MGSEGENESRMNSSPAYMDKMRPQEILIRKIGSHFSISCFTMRQGTAAGDSNAE
jgi:hypothetical protein